MDKTQEILSSLIAEIAVVTGRNETEVKPDSSFGENGVNSLGFIEILLFVKNEWNVDFTGGGLGMSDVNSIRTLAGRIAAGTPVKN